MRQFAIAMFMGSDHSDFEVHKGMFRGYACFATVRVMSAVHST